MRSWEISASGERAAFEAGVDPEEFDEDEYKVNQMVLSALMAANDHDASTPVADFTLIRRAQGLSPRLQSLADEITLAGQCRLVEVAGQRLLQTELPDGGRRLSAVTDAELAELTAQTGIAPG